jgi:hypothetical protein
MKKLITNTNPFALLLIPVLFAMIVGISYQVKIKSFAPANGTYMKATSLYTKSVTLFKAVCAIHQQNVW